MNFFKFLNIFHNDLAIDLGTANTVIWKNGEIVLNEPSIVAYDDKQMKLIAIGTDAKLMLGRTPKGIEIMKPMKDGVIANPQIAEAMLRSYISKLAGNFARRIIVCVPAGVTEAEKIIVRDSCEHAGAKEVHLIAEPMAGAIGLNLDVLGPQGNMIVDIGGGTTEIAVIALGGIVCNQSIKVAGNVLTDAVLQYFRDVHQLRIGENTAEDIKIQAGSAYPFKGEKDLQVNVKGNDIVNGIPKMITVSPAEIRENALSPQVQNIINAILKLLEETPPELAKDIYDRGIMLSGGGSLLRGLAKRISNATHLSVGIYKEISPLFAVVTGTGIVLDAINKNHNEYRSVLIKHSTYL
ncbi:MAG: rod shape-determining protein [Ignavibacteria bacterium]|jgi:rod shape-determining protein MreB|nr:rod shape-determining protein [Ignavibacteria bacterium]